MTYDGGTPLLCSARGGGVGGVPLYVQSRGILGGYKGSRGPMGTFKPFMACHVRSDSDGSEATSDETALSGLLGEGFHEKY